MKLAIIIMTFAFSFSALASCPKNNKPAFTSIETIRPEVAIR